MNTKIKKVTIFASIILILALLFGIFSSINIANNKNSSNSSSTSSQTSSSFSATEGLKFSFVNGEADKNAFEETQKVFKIEFQEYPSFGKMITSIQDVKPDSSHFWKLVVNGEDAQVGAENLKLKLGDKVDWVYTKIQ